MKPTAGLENWCVIEMAFQHTRLSGIVDGHLEIEDGKRVFTSSVQSADYANRKVETRHTIYELGTPDPRWVESLTPEQRAQYAVEVNATA